MNRRFLIVSALVLVLAGCIRAQMIRFEATSRSPKPPDYLIEVIEKDQVKKPYKVIGEIWVRTGPAQDPNSVLNKMREAAKEMGGDALMDFGIQDARTGAIMPVGSAAVFVAQVRYIAKVIVFE